MLFFSAFLTSVLVIRKFLKQKTPGVKKTVFVLAILFLLDGILCYIVYRIPLFYENIPVAEDNLCEKTDLSNISRISSSHIFYTNPEVWVEDEIDHVIIRMPVGKYRSVYVEKDSETVEYFLEDSPFENIMMESILKVMFLMFGGFVLPHFLIKIFTFKFNRIKQFLKTNIYGFFSFFILMAQFAFNRANQIENWGACWYAANYSMGIGSRFFIGSILSLFYGDFLDQNLAYKFCAIAIILLIVCVSFLINYTIKHAEISIIDSVKYLFICFLCCPGSIAAMWNKGVMGRLEMYTLLLSLIGVIVFNCVKHTIIKYFLITLIAIISMAVYQGYLFLYFPILFVVIICDIFNETKTNNNYWIYGVLSCLFTGISFLYFQFFSYVKYEDATSMSKTLSQKTDLYIETTAIHYECFASVADAYKKINTKFLLTNGEFPREKLFLTFCILAPSFIIVLAIYAKCFSLLKYKQIKIIKMPYLYCILINLAVLPQFILNVDWGRWLTALIINIFFGIYYLTYLEFPEMIKALQALNAYIIKHKETATFCIIYLTLLDKFGARNFLSQVDMLWNDICNLLYNI